MKPKDKAQSHLQFRFRHPHDIWYNHDQGMRIAKKRWKRALAKHERRRQKAELTV